jgi:opacity protein-like surface antigen
VSQTDSVAVLYKQSLISQTQNTNTGTSTTASSNIDTNAQSVTTVYTRATPSWTFVAGGGVSLIEPASKAFAIGNIRVQTNPERSTVLQLDLSRQAAPSFYLQAGAMISNVAQVQVFHMLEKHLRLRASANYGFNEIVPTESNTTFNNFVFSTGLNYRITKTVSADLTYDYNNFKTQSPSLNYTVNRNVVGIMLTAEWR